MTTPVIIIQQRQPAIEITQASPQVIITRLPIGVGGGGTGASGLLLGETAIDAYRGDRGAVAYNHSQNPHAPANAQRNVQADWGCLDAAADSFVRNKPEAMPANDVPAWAKAPVKPSYTPAEVGAIPADNPVVSTGTDYTTARLRNTKIMSAAQVNAAGGTDGVPIADNFDGNGSYVDVY